METIGERARSNGMSVPEMLRVYAASGSCVTVPLDPPDLRSFAQFLEAEERADENARLAEKLEAEIRRYEDINDQIRQFNREVMENHRTLLRHRRISGWCAVISLVATAGWVAWVVAGL